MLQALQYIGLKGSKLTIQKFFLYYFLVFFHILILTRVWASSLLFAIILPLEDVYTLIIAAYIGYKVLRRIMMRNYQINTFQLFLLILFLPIIQVCFTTHYEFGQPILYGIAAMSDYLNLYGCLLIYDLVKNKKIPIEVVENAYLGVAWLSLLFFYAMSLFTNPAMYRDTPLAAGNSMKGGAVYYGFNMSMMFFGSVYYFIKAFFKKNYLYFLYSSLFIIYIVFFRFDRTVMAFTFGSMGLFFLLYVPVRKQFIFLFQFILPGILLLLIGAVIFPEIYDMYILMFKDIVATITGNEVEVGKESVRVYEMSVANKFLSTDKTLLFGSGKISNSWVEGGFNYFYGYFYPSDLGIFGMVFMFGIPVSLLIYSQFLLAFYWIKKTKSFRQNQFYMSLVFYLLCMFFDCLTNAFLVTFAAQTMIVISLLHYYYSLEVKDAKKVPVNP